MKFPGATALMPIPLLWNVKMNANAKISVGAILGLGIFASISACIRLKYTVNLTSATEYLCKIASYCRRADQVILTTS